MINIIILCLDIKLKEPKFSLLFLWTITRSKS